MELERAPELEISVENEGEYIRRTQEGDSAAFNQLVRLHQARLRAFAARSILSNDIVYDIVQDTFLSAFEHIDRFELDKDFGKWLRGICRNRMLRYFREQRKRQRGFTVIAELLEARLLREDITRRDDSLERIEALRTCLDKLKSADRQLITDRYYEEMSVKDMAAQLGKNAAAVSVKLMRIRAALRKCYEKKMRDTQNRRP